MTDSPKPLSDAAEFMLLLIRLVKEHNRTVTKALLVNAAILQAVSDKVPGLHEAYLRYLEASERDSPVAEQGRQIAAQLDALTARMRDDPPGS